MKDCSASGSVDMAVQRWVKELGFDKNFPRSQAISYLRGFGAWEAEELERMSDTELAQWILWIFCGNIADGEDYCSLNF